MKKFTSRNLESFKQEHRQLCVSRLRLVCYAALISNTCFIFTDLIFKQGPYLYFFLLRMVIHAALIIVLLYVRFCGKSALKHSSFVMLLLATTCGLVMFFMCLPTGGFQSIYASGFVFLLLMVQSIFPWNYHYHALLGLLYLGLYLFQGFWIGFETIGNLSVLTSGWMIIAVGLLTSITAYMQYNLRYQLKEAQAELIRGETLQAIGQLSAGVAHNINTYMSGVDLGLTTLLQKQTDATSRIVATAALESVRHTKAIVSTLEDFAQKNPREQHLFTIHEVIESAINMFRLQPLAHLVSIHYQPHDSLQVTGRSQDMKAAFLNLLKNAAQATAKNIWLDVVQADNHVTITVKDDGSGMEEKIRERVFEPFFTTKDVGQGTGLGLWMVHRTVREHGGSIDVLSSHGQGTQFVLQLPAG